MSFSSEVSEKALISCGRHCCLCHRFCGTKMELHHIVQKADGGANTFENCIPLCFDCHADVKAYNPKHPKGKKYTETELKVHRDNWYAKVEKSSGVIAHPDLIEVDRATFQKFREILPSTGAIAFIREHNFGEPFRVDDLSDLFKFCDKYSKIPEFEFLDIDLESMRAELIRLSCEFVYAGAKYTFPWQPEREIERWNCVQKYNRDGMLVEDFYSIVTKLNDLSTRVCEAYDDLIRICRRKLAVP